MLAPIRQWRGREVLRATFAALVSLGVAAISIGGCGSDNAVVGGSCAPPFTECSLACVDLMTDPNNCGACAHACPPGAACLAGFCSGSTDASLDGDATVGDGGDSGDAWLDDGTAEPDGRPRDGSGGDGTGGEGGSGEGGVCQPPYNSPDYCGDCNTKCAPPNDICSPVDGGYACVPTCTPPLVACGRQCVDTQTDGFNCGSCFHVCPTFICIGGQCSSGVNGDFVVIGHDYASPVPSPGSQQSVLTNAVFLRRPNPLRVLSYERYANAAAVTRVTNILQTFAAQNARTLQITHTSTDADIPSKLTTTNFDALLVFDQETAPTGALAALGASWAATLAAYENAGGMAVVLDGAAGTVKEMPQFITATGLLNVTGETSMTQGSIVRNNAPGDAIGVNVSSQYGVTNHSARMTADPAAPPTLTYVFVEPVSSQPTVIHKTF